MKTSWVRAAALVVATVAGVAGAVALAGAPAYAHNSFSSSTPKDKAVLNQAPAAVTLKFLAKLSPQGTRVTLVDPAGVPATGGPATFNGATVSVPLKATVAGLYTVGYEVASSDGHPITGKITFTLTAQAVPSPTAAAPAIVAPTSSAAPAPEPTLRNTASEATGGTPWWAWPIVAAAVLAGVVGFLLVRRRRAAP